MNVATDWKSIAPNVGKSFNMLSEDDITTQYLRICTVLEIFFHDGTFFPKQDDFEDLNPTRSPMKRKIHKIEACWEWRNKVNKALRTQDRLYCHEMLWQRRYMTNFENHAFWHYYLDGVWNELAGIAVLKVNRLFERLGVYWE